MVVTLPRKADNELLRIARDIIGKTYGEIALQLFDYMLENNGYVAEETLTKDTGIKSNEGRKVLQKMSEEAIIVPGKLKKGDATLHTWVLNKVALKSFVLNRLKKAREKLEARLSYERDNIIYECPVCGRRYSFEEAYLNDFKCVNEGADLLESNNDEIISFLQSKIKELDEKIAELSEL
uniref:Transcription factor E n=1 Tax=Thermosphaera aggregans TaxID=54254 RepID=A0A7C2BMA2_9CREN